jgi:hypothetical protein
MARHTVRGFAAIQFVPDNLGLEWGLDQVTPVEFVLGVVCSASRDGSEIRSIIGSDGRRYKVNRFTYLLPREYYPCAVMAVARSAINVLSVKDATDWLKNDVRHLGAYRAAVVTHDLSPVSTVVCECYALGFRK